MSKLLFNVAITPAEAMKLLKEQQNAELVDEELIDLGEGKFLATLVFEKYYFRASNRAALMVIIDNISGKTRVKSVATGSSQGMVFNFDWGAADDFAGSVEKILASYIIR